MIDNMTTLWTAASWIVFASIKGIAVIALVLLCRQFFAPWFSAQSRHRLWFAVVACLTVPFGLEVDSRLISSPSALSAEEHVSNIGVQGDSGVPPDRATTNDLRKDSLSSRESPMTRASYFGSSESIAFVDRPSTRSAMVIVWLGVAAALFAFAQWNQFHYLRIRSRAREVDSSVARLFTRCKAEMAVSRAVRLLETRHVRSPAIFGCWSPTLLLPAGLSSQLSESQLRHVFLHELAHVRRHDIVVNWVTTCAQIIHWFNPFVWYALRQMRADMEQACDARVLKQLSRNEQVAYGETLIRLTDFYPIPMPLSQGVGIVESHSQMKARIQRIAQFKPARIAHSILAFFVLTAITSVAVTQPRIDPNPESKLASVGAGENNVSVQRTAVQVAVLHTTAAKEESAVHASQSSDNNPTGKTLEEKASVQLAQVVDTKKAVPQDGSLHTEYLRLNYAKASELAALIASNNGISLLSEHGNVSVDERTNTLLVRDTVERLADVRRMVATLDVPVQRIQMGMRILLVDEDLSRDLVAKAVPVDAVAVRASSGDIIFPPSDASFDAKLSAALNDGRAELVAVPRVVVANGQEAMVQQGMELPYSELTSGVSITKHKMVVLTLKATPKVTRDNRIAVEIDVMANGFLPHDASAQASRTPTAEVRRIVRNALMPDGYTLMLDGLLETGKLDLQQGSTVSGENKKQQLLILLTATILPKQEPLYPSTL